MTFNKPEIRSPKLETNPKFEGSKFLRFEFRYSSLLRIWRFELRNLVYAILPSSDITLESSGLLQKSLRAARVERIRGEAGELGAKPHYSGGLTRSTFI